MAQQTTTKRCNITVPPKYRLHVTYEHDLDELRCCNTGLCRILGKVFGEFIHQFVTGGDETNYLANDNNCGVKVIGAANITKHDKNVKLLPLPQPRLRARTYAETNPSAQRATQLRSVLARVFSNSRQNLNTTTVP
jgi:hypothetical protein